MYKRIVLYIMIGIMLTLTPLYYVNNILLSDSSPIVIESSKDNGKKELEPLYSKVKLPDDAKYISMLYSGDHISYVDSGVLYIKNLKDDKMSSEITGDSPVIYAAPLYDRNIILYFTYKGEKLHVWTYELDSGIKKDQKSIVIEDLYCIRDVRFSSLMNVIYIDAQVKVSGAVNDNTRNNTQNTNKGNPEDIANGAAKETSKVIAQETTKSTPKTNTSGTIKDYIYRIDIMKDTTLFSSSKKITNMGLLYNEDELVYQDDANNIYIKNKIFEYNGYRKFNLLGIDRENKVYILPLENPSEMFIIKDRAVVETRYIDDKDYTVCKDKGNEIYLVYKDHILDLPDNTVVKIPPGVMVLDINNHNLLFEDENDEVSVEKI